MEGDNLELSQFPYNSHQFSYNSHQSPLGTTGSLIACMPSWRKTIWETTGLAMFCGVDFFTIKK